jgi:hypothetical protein
MEVTLLIVLTVYNWILYLWITIANNWEACVNQPGCFSVPGIIIIILKLFYIAEGEGNEIGCISDPCGYLPYFMEDYYLSFNDAISEMFNESCEYVTNEGKYKSFQCYNLPGG